MPRGFRDAVKRFPAPGAGWGCPLRLIVVRNSPLLLREEFLFLQIGAVKHTALKRKGGPIRRQPGPEPIIKPQGANGSCHGSRCSRGSHKMAGTALVSDAGKFFRVGP